MKHYGILVLYFTYLIYVSNQQSFEEMQHKKNLVNSITEYVNRIKVPQYSSKEFEKVELTHKGRIYGYVENSEIKIVSYQGYDKLYEKGEFTNFKNAVLTNFENKISGMIDKLVYHPATSPLDRANFRSIGSTIFSSGKLYFYGIFTVVRAVPYKKYDGRMDTTYYQKECIKVINYKEKISLNGLCIEMKEDITTTIPEQTPKKNKDEIIEYMKESLNEVEIRNRYYDRYVGKTDINIKFIYESFKNSELEEIVKKYELPQQVQDQLELLAFEKKTNNLVKIEYNQFFRTGRLTLIYGYAVKDGEVISLGYAHSITSCSIKKLVCSEEYRLNVRSVTREYYENYLRKYQVPCRERMDDHNIFDCCNYMEGTFTDEENDGIKSYLISYTEKEILKKINEMDLTQTLFSEDIILHSNNNLYEAKIYSGRIEIYKIDPKLKTKISCYILGIKQNYDLRPYSLSIRENDFIYMLNKDNDRVYSFGKISNGKKPFKIVLEDSGNLYIRDASGNNVANLNKMKIIQ